MVIAFDTNFFIYLLQHHPEFEVETKKFVKTLAIRGNSGVTSVLSLLELLSFDKEESTIKFLRTAFLELPNLKVFNVNQEVAEKGARIRRTYEFKTADTIQLATAVIHKADIFVTNDQRLKQFKEVKIQLLSELG